MLRFYKIIFAVTVVVCAYALIMFVANRPAQATPAVQSGSDGSSNCRDNDGDGFGMGCSAGDDCNDSDSTIHPQSQEVCNNRDDDCNGLVDDGANCPEPPIELSRVTVPKGRFLMGSDSGPKDERPAHVVTVSSLEIDRYEVTNEQYAACVKDGKCKEPVLLSSHRRKDYYRNPDFADYPVIFVDWYQANLFCQYAGGRLPTEAEWEKAARGDDMKARTYPWGETPPMCDLANMGGAMSCVGDTDRVGRRPAGQSPYGAMDMAGNVWEWVSDWYDADYYQSSPATDPQGPTQGRLKVMRGGCWESGADSLRVSCRKAELPSTWAYNVGFRCVYRQGR
jgi:eukaryotic-like serine/threonine-protein kinase